MNGWTKYAGQYEASIIIYSASCPSKYACSVFLKNIILVLSKQQSFKPQKWFI